MEMRRFAPAMLGIALIAAVVTTAGAGVLRGELTFAGARVRGRHYDDAVVWIAQLPEAAERKLVQVRGRWPWSKSRPLVIPMPRLVETGHHYEPHVSVLVAGSAIEVRNQDEVWHGTFSVTPGGNFDLGKRAPGSVDTVHFQQPGVFAMRCDIHPDMSGWIAVTPNHAYARVDESGQWQLPTLPPGEYELHAWHPDRGETHVTVHVPAKGDTLIRLHW
jgi:hypothetical protein